jgi:hypothetical protein
VNPIENQHHDPQAPGTEAGGDPPNVLGHQGEDDRRQGRDQRPVEAGSQAPGTVRSDHAAEQAKAPTRGERGEPGGSPGRILVGQLG